MQGQGVSLQSAMHLTDRLEEGIYKVHRDENHPQYSQKMNEVLIMASAQTTEWKRMVELAESARKGEKAKEGSAEVDEELDRRTAVGEAVDRMINDDHTRFLKKWLRDNHCHPDSLKNPMNQLGEPTSDLHQKRHASRSDQSGVSTTVAGEPQRQASAPNYEGPEEVNRPDDTTTFGNSWGKNRPHHGRLNVTRPLKNVTVDAAHKSVATQSTDEAWLNDCGKLQGGPSQLNNLLADTKNRGQVMEVRKQLYVTEISCLEELATLERKFIENPLPLMLFPLDGNRVDEIDDDGKRADLQWFSATAYLNNAFPVLILPHVFRQVQDALKTNLRRINELKRKYEQAAVASTDYEREIKWHTTPTGTTATGSDGEILPRLAAWLTRPDWDNALVKVDPAERGLCYGIISRVTELESPPWTPRLTHPSVRGKDAEESAPLTSVQDIHNEIQQNPGVNHWIIIGPNSIQSELARQLSPDDPKFEENCEAMRTIVRQQEFFRSAKFFAELAKITQGTASTGARQLDRRLRFHVGSYLGWKSVVTNKQTERYWISREMPKIDALDDQWFKPAKPVSEYELHAIRVTSRGRVTMYSSAVTCPISVQHVLSAEGRSIREEVYTTKKLIGSPTVAGLGPHWDPLTAVFRPPPPIYSPTQVTLEMALEVARGPKGTMTALVPEEITGWVSHPRDKEEEEENLILLQLEIWQRATDNLSSALLSPYNHQYFDTMTQGFEAIKRVGRETIQQRIQSRGNEETRHDQAPQSAWRPRGQNSTNADLAIMSVPPQETGIQLDVMF
jgi:hypothetical protein